MDCFNKNLPCLSFVLASMLSIAAFSSGITMCIILKPNDGMIPFWSSLVTSSIAVWVKMPSYNDKKNINPSLNEI